MELTDTHCHLDKIDLTPYQGDLNKAIKHAENQGIKHFLCVCITLEDFPAMLALTKLYPNVHATVGLHPNEREIEKEPTGEELIQLAQDEKVVGIGETGLDYYRSTGDLTWQQDRFREHIRAAKTLKKPIIVHSRQARADTIKIMKEEGASEVGGIMHCFTEDWDMAQQALELNFHISFSGIVTFKNAKEIQEVARRVPLERMLLETDSPYLAPEPHRGKSNEPAYVRYTCEFIASMRGIDSVELAARTTSNYLKLFKV